MISSYYKLTSKDNSVVFRLDILAAAAVKLENMRTMERGVFNVAVPTAFINQTELSICNAFHC